MDMVCGFSLILVEFVLHEDDETMHSATGERSHAAVCL